MSAMPREDDRDQACPPERDRPVTWVVTASDGETVLYERAGLAPRFWDYWRGSNRLFRRLADGRLRGVNYAEYEEAMDAYRAR